MSGSTAVTLALSEDKAHDLLSLLWQTEDEQRRFLGRDPDRGGPDCLEEAVEAEEIKDFCGGLANELAAMMDAIGIL